MFDFSFGICNRRKNKNMRHSIFWKGWLYAEPMYKYCQMKKYPGSLKCKYFLSAFTIENTIVIFSAVTIHPLKHETWWLMTDTKVRNALKFVLNYTSIPHTNRSIIKWCLIIHDTHESRHRSKFSHANGLSASLRAGYWHELWSKSGLDSLIGPSACMLRGQ